MEIWLLAIRISLGGCNQEKMTLLSIYIDTKSISTFILKHSIETNTFKYFFTLCLLFPHFFWDGQDF